MAERRRFTANFKRQVVEELLSESSTLAQLSRRYDISSGLIRHWTKRYEQGGLVEGPLSAREGTSSAQCGVGADGEQTHNGE